MAKNRQEPAEPIKDDTGDYRYDSQDPRLMASHRLLLANPSIIFNDPLEAATAFGIKLSPKFAVVSMGQEHLIEFVSPQFQEFLNKPASELSTPEDIPWDVDPNPALSCLNLMREALTKELPVYALRKCENIKFLTLSNGRYKCLNKAYILSNLKVMFVDFSSQELVSEKSSSTEEDFVWDDVDLFGAEPVGAGTFTFDFEPELTFGKPDKPLGLNMGPDSDLFADLTKW